MGRLRDLFSSPSRATLRSRAKNLATGPLAQWYEEPALASSTPIARCDMLAVDVETTGFIAGGDHLLSIAWVGISDLTVDLSVHGHRLVRQPHGTSGVGHSATLHGITDDLLERDGLPIETILPEFLNVLGTRPLVAHFAKMELTFLGHHTQQLYGADFVPPVIDTLQLEHDILAKGFDVTIPSGQLRLLSARERYGLPWYPPHDALTDAIACAELFIAQAKTLHDSRKAPLTLGDVWKTR